MNTRNAIRRSTQQTAMAALEPADNDPGPPLESDEVSGWASSTASEAAVVVAVVVREGCGFVSVVMTVMETPSAADAGRTSPNLALAL